MLKWDFLDLVFSMENILIIVSMKNKAQRNFKDMFWVYLKFCTFSFLTKTVKRTLTFPLSQFVAIWCRSIDKSAKNFIQCDLFISSTTINFTFYVFFAASPAQQIEMEEKIVWFVFTELQLTFGIEKCWLLRRQMMIRNWRKKRVLFYFSHAVCLQLKMICEGLIASWKLE